MRLSVAGVWVPPADLDTWAYFAMAEAAGKSSYAPTLGRIFIIMGWCKFTRVPLGVEVFDPRAEDVDDELELRDFMCVAYVLVIHH